MNGDGKADIVVANETDTILILMSNGAAVLLLLATLPDIGPSLLLLGI